MGATGGGATQNYKSIKAPGVGQYRAEVGSVPYEFRNFDFNAYRAERGNVPLAGYRGRLAKDLSDQEIVDHFMQQRTQDGTKSRDVLRDQEQYVSRAISRYGWATGQEMREKVAGDTPAGYGYTKNGMKDVGTVGGGSNVMKKAVKSTKLGTSGE